MEIAVENGNPGSRNFEPQTLKSGFLEQSPLLSHNISKHKKEIAIEISVKISEI